MTESATCPKMDARWIGCDESHWRIMLALPLTPRLASWAPVNTKARTISAQGFVVKHFWIVGNFFFTLHFSSRSSTPIYIYWVALSFSRCAHTQYCDNFHSKQRNSTFTLASEHTCFWSTDFQVFYLWLEIIASLLISYYLGDGGGNKTLIGTR